MYGVSATGVLMALLVLIDPLGIHGGDLSKVADPQAKAAMIRSFWTFLLYLSLLTVTSVRHGLLVLACKQNRQPLRQFRHLILTVSLTALGPVLAWWGHQSGMTLLMIFGGLGLFVGANMLHYSFKQKLDKNHWLIEHLGAMIGSGIAAYTAFFSFGMRRLMTDSGALQLLAWILPGIIGTIFIRYLSNHYRKKFSPAKLKPQPVATSASNAKEQKAL
jgi:uncharacterized membrane protein HdeD (DUF308 family)